MLDEKIWIKLNKFPQSVGDIHEIVEINNVFYVIGSEGISTLNNDIYKFPSNKYYDVCETCLVGNNILVVCNEKWYDYNDDVESRLFNPINKQYSNVDIRTDRRYFGFVYYLNNIFIVGGWNGRQPLNSIEVYDPVTKTQALSPIKMNEARSYHGVVVYKKKLFVFGGQDEDGKPLNSVEMFSPEANKFVMLR